MYSNAIRFCLDGGFEMKGYVFYHKAKFATKTRTALDGTYLKLLDVLM